MPPIFDKFRKSSRSAYSIDKLVDFRMHSPFDEKHHGPQIICDIDKTYLETSFESLVKLAQIAFEDADDKVTVEGASDVLLASRWGNLLEKTDPKGLFPRPLHFVSSSPPQLRKVLEEKLEIDGLDWTSDTFKDQAYNIKRGRFDLLKQQIAYKSAAILAIIKKFGEGATFYCIGDNAESDPFIYLGIKHVVEKRLSLESFAEYLMLGGIEKDVAFDLIQSIELPNQCQVGGILIRDLNNYSMNEAAPLTNCISLFRNFFEAGLYLLHWGVIPLESMIPLIVKAHNNHGMELEDLSGYLLALSDQDISQDFQNELAKAKERISEAAGDAHAPETQKDFVFNQKGEQYSNISEKEILECAKTLITHQENH